MEQFDKVLYHFINRQFTVLTFPFMCTLPNLLHLPAALSKDLDRPIFTCADHMRTIGSETQTSNCSQTQTLQLVHYRSLIGINNWHHICADRMRTVTTLHTHFFFLQIGLIRQQKSEMVQSTLTKQGISWTKHSSVQKKMAVRIHHIGLGLIFKRPQKFPCCTILPFIQTLY